MKKIILIVALMLVGCQGTKSVYTQTEQEILEKYKVLDIAENQCDNQDSVKKMLKGEFEKENIKSYCSMKLSSSKGVNALIKAGVSKTEIKQYQRVPYFHADKVDRYLAYPDDNIKNKIKYVNMNLDLAPYAITNTMSDDTNLEMLINKYNALPKGYIPQDLVSINYICTQGVDYSCSTMDKIQLRSEAALAYEQFAEAAQKEGMNMVAIAAYRAYTYQESLYNYNKDLQGEAYADQYYARPGQSEHNSGLAVDITFNGHDYNTIEDKEGYSWVMRNMHKFGFILRYPEGKEDLTQYGYESWHIRYVGKELAKKLFSKNITLDEYYGMR